jgi:hypothetical protein
MTTREVILLADSEAKKEKRAKLERIHNFFIFISVYFTFKQNKRIIE